MKNLIRLSDYTKSDAVEIFKIADAIQQGEYRNYLKDSEYFVQNLLTPLLLRVTV